MSNTTNGTDRPSNSSNTVPYPDPANIREQAREKARSITPPDLDSMTQEESQQLFYEIQTKRLEAELENEQLRNRVENYKSQAELLATVTENMLDMVVLSDLEGNITFDGKAHEKLGYEDGFLIGKNVMEFVHPKHHSFVLEEFNKLLSSGGPRTVEHLFRCNDGSYMWLETLGRIVTDESNNPQKIIFSARQITKRKQAEEELKKIEWMLSSHQEQSLVAGRPLEDPYILPYGNLTELNTSREILDAVGEETLKNIVNDFLDMLATSVAVYERNGDYALGIFSSDWCRSMDRASFQLCGTEDREQALRCGKWLCHESCWSTAKQAIDTGAPVDVACEGGIRLYAAPIWASGEIIGTINVGYGDPPADISRLSELASKYGVDVKELSRWSNGYESRPPFVIELAKRRIHSAAQLIGEIVERKQAEEALKESETKFRQLFESSPISLWEQDFSAVKNWIDEIKVQNIDDLDSYFLQRPELLWKIAGMVKVLDVNPATLRLYRAKSKEEFFGDITKVFSKESLDGFLQVLKVIAAGEKSC